MIDPQYRAENLDALTEVMQHLPARTPWGYMMHASSRNWMVDFMTHDLRGLASIGEGEFYAGEWRGRAHVYTWDLGSGAGVLFVIHHRNSDGVWGVLVIPRVEGAAIDKVLDTLYDTFSKSGRVDAFLGAVRVVVEHHRKGRARRKPALH